MLKSSNTKSWTILFTALLLVATLGGASYGAQKGERSETPSRYLARSLDGPLVQMQNDLDGSLWSAWAYRSGGEYDVAVSVLHSDGVWSEPLMLGANDGRDQLDPALAVDANGSIYVAFSDQTAAGSTISVAVHLAGSNHWSLISNFASGHELSAPELMIVGDRLIIAYRDQQQVGLVQLPLTAPESNSTHSIYDGPDPTTSHEEEGESGSDGGPEMGPPQGDSEIIPITSDGPRSQRRSNGNG